MSRVWPFLVLILATVKMCFIYFLQSQVKHHFIISLLSLFSFLTYPFCANFGGYLVQEPELAPSQGLLISDHTIISPFTTIFFLFCFEQSSLFQPNVTMFTTSGLEKHKHNFLWAQHQSESTNSMGAASQSLSERINNENEDFWFPHQTLGLSYGLSYSRQEYGALYWKVPTWQTGELRWVTVCVSVCLWQRLSSFSSLKLASEPIGNGSFIIHLP